MGIPARETAEKAIRVAANRNSLEMGTARLEPDEGFVRQYAASAFRKSGQTQVEAVVEADRGRGLGGSSRRDTA